MIASTFPQIDPPYRRASARSAGHHRQPAAQDSSGFALTRSQSAHGVVRLVLSGQIDLAVIDQLRHNILAALAAEETEELLIDLHAVTFLDCCGIGVLVTGSNAAAAGRRRYRLVHPQGLVRDLLTITGVLQPAA